MDKYNNAIAIMDIKKCTKESFSVIGKECSTNDGDGFIMDYSCL